MFSINPTVRAHSPTRHAITDSWVLQSGQTVGGFGIEWIQEPFPGGVEHRAIFNSEEPSDKEVSVGFQIGFPGLVGAHIAIPAAVYAGNRFRAKPFPYPCIISDPEDFRADLPNTISNVARIPVIQLLAGDTAMPAVGIGDFASNTGVWLLTDPHTSIGQPLLEVIEGKSTTVSILVPGVRYPYRYQGCGEKWVPSEDRGWRPGPGDSVEVRIRVLEFPATNPTEMYQPLFEHRHDIWPASGRHELPWSAAFEVQEAKYNRENWDPERDYYAVGDRQTRYAHWQIGWVGGGISSHALLSAGNPETQQRAIATLDWIADRGQSPSGFYWSVGIEDEMFSDMVDMEWGHDWHLIRRSGDALYFFCKQIWLAGEMRGTWLASVRLCADAFVRLWETEGQFGQFVSQETGEIRVGRTASGAIASAGLALAARLLNQPRYLEVAKEAARYYVREFLREGFTSGGPGEASQCPDSESAFGLLESLITLFEETGEPEWRDLAEEAAWLAASWVMPYDFKFLATSSFGRLDMRTTGTVWANSQNKHSAPGICTLSGVSLLKLYRATKNRLYLELLKHISHAISQYLSRNDRPVFEMPAGWMCERVNTSDWEHPQTPVGEGFSASCWCEISSLLTFAELPGIYVQPDTGYAVTLDHVDVDIQATKSQLTLLISNPTKFDAHVKLLAEASTELDKPLGQDFARNLPQVSIPFNQSVSLTFDRATGRVVG